MCSRCVRCGSGSFQQFQVAHHMHGDVNMRTQIPTRIIVCAAFAILLAGGRAFAQDRGGFTALVDVGVGIQSDSSIEETAVGLSGLNFGIGGFLYFWRGEQEYGRG